MSRLAIRLFFRREGTFGGGNTVSLAGIITFALVLRRRNRRGFSALLKRGALETRRREHEEADTSALRCRAYTPRKILIRWGLSDPSFGSYR